MEFRWHSWPWRGRPFPLSRHLVALVLGAMVPLVVFAAVIVQRLAAQERLASERRLANASHDLAMSVDQEIAATIRTLMALAESAAVRRADIDEFRDELERVLASQATWLTVRLHTPDGVEVYDARRKDEAPAGQLSDPDSFAEVLASGRPVIGSLKPRPDGELGFPVRVPVVLEGRPIYVLTAVISSEAMQRIVQRSATTPGEWTRAVMDTAGTIVARSRDPETFVGKRNTASFIDRGKILTLGFVRDTTVDGQDVYFSFQRTPLASWTVAVAVPHASFEAPVRKSLLIVTSVGALLLFVFGGVALLYARRLAESIRSAARGAELLAVGGAPVIARSRVSEVESLRHALLSSAELLKQRERVRNEHLGRVNAAKADAEAASQAKDRFLAMLGHELRNPLGAISNGVFLLRDVLPKNVEASEVQGIIERQLRHLSRMLDDLLDASRIARGKITLDKTPIDLSSVLTDLVKDFAHSYAQARVNLTIAVPTQDGVRQPVIVLGDRTRLSQCVSNLLHNALKFTPSGGEVRVSLAIDGAAACVTVEDDGAGIEPESLSRIFQPFFHCERSVARESSGLGLGLSVVKGLIDLHGGSVRAESRGPGGGSQISFTLPFEAGVATPVRQQRLLKRQGARAHRVLVIDGMSDAADTLGTMLVRHGHEVRVAYDGLSGLEFAPEFDPEVVICDIGLPDIDGFEVCRRLRQAGGGSPRLFVALSGYGQSDDVCRAKIAGFDHHMTKPVDLERLMDWLGEGAGPVVG